MTRRIELRRLLFIASILIASPACFATTYSSIQAMSGWGSCAACAGANGAGPVVGLYMRQHEGSPSLDGNSTEYHIGGGHPYSDVLFWKRLGSTSSATHHFVYDTYFYLTNPGAAQNLEFDINQFVSGRSFILGTQCNIRGGHVWQVWNEPSNSWASTGVYCATPTAYHWNHLTIEAERTWDNKLHYIAITLNGWKHYINRYYGSRGTSWNGVTVNFQLDGDSAQTPYSTWLDKLTLTSW